MEFGDDVSRFLSDANHTFADDYNALREDPYFFFVLGNFQELASIIQVVLESVMGSRTMCSE